LFQVISICTQYFFTACFTFMLLESLHIYALVASVVKERGMLTRKQNLLVGLGLPFFIVLCNMCFEFDNYGGQYHCWLQMDTGGCNSYGQKPVLGHVVGPPGSGSISQRYGSGSGSGSSFLRLKIMCPWLNYKKKI
jgi:hypothetical protein